MVVAEQLSTFERQIINLSTVTNDNRTFALSPNDSWPTTTCRHGWDYESEPYTTSVVSDWNLVCDRKLLVPLALSIFSLGGLIGNAFCGYMQDSMGRRPTFFVFLFILSVFGVATAFAPNYDVWITLRFFNGMAIPAISSTPYVLAIELVGPGHRTLMSILVNIMYTLILILLSIVVYLVREWRQLVLATTVPFIAFFLYWWVLPESPRWLLAHEKFEETEKIIRTIAHVNRRTLRPDYFVTLKRKFQVESSMKGRDYNDCNRNYHLIDLLRTPNMRRKTLIITAIWFAIGCGYFGLSYYAPLLSSDKYLNFLLASVAEVPTYIFLWPSMEYWGRRWTLWLSLMIAGVACVLTFLVPEDPASMLVLYCFGKFGVSSAFVVLPLAASEIYPTVVRGLGTNFSSFVSMVAPICMPFVNVLSERNLSLPLVIIGVLLVFSGFLSLLLPETLHQRLPQTLEEGEEIGKDLTWRDHLRCCPIKPSIEPSLSTEEEFRLSEDRAESPLRSLLEQQVVVSQTKLETEENITVL
ncbi:hypothetical protein CHUAL_004879 [Chamberlinius hualienensis]